MSLGLATATLRTSVHREPRMIRSILISIIAVVFALGHPALANTLTFQAWPEDLPRYTLTRSQVEANWEQLTGGKRGPFPDASSLRAEAARYPQLMATTQTIVERNRDHPRLQEALLDWSDHDYRIAAGIIADAWVALFNGDFSTAWELGRLVGPPGYFPALYALALNAQYLETDPDKRIAQLELVLNETRELLKQAPDHEFLQFGHAYAKSRRLETMGMLEARSTGFLEEILAALEKLDKQDPDNLYTVTLRGAVYAGTLEKAGSMLARMTYRIRPAMVDEAFSRALALNTRGFAAPMLEYAIALEKFAGEDRRKDIHNLLLQASAIKPNSAEAALHQQVAKQWLTGSRQ